jgi:hypothetical protein
MFLANKLNKGGSLGGYQISRSLRFNSADSAYLNRTPASATNRRTWTWSGWIKRSSLVKTNELVLFACRPSAYTIFSIRHSSSANPDTILLEDNNGTNLRTTQVFRDVSAWYHIVLAVDTTQATSTDRVKLYVNGSQVTAFSATTYPTQNLDMQINTANAHGVGGYSFNTAETFDGYMTEVNFIDGTQLTPSSFGETNAQTGVWGPKAYSGSYGANGFYLNFSDNSNTTAATLGKDYSGNGNNWTPNNFSVTAGAGNDSLVDSPTSYGVDTGVGGTVRGNYATLNPLSSTAGTVTGNGNLQLLSNASHLSVTSTIGVTSGKWYSEVFVSTFNALGIGVTTLNTFASGYPGGITGLWWVYDNGASNAGNNQTTQNWNSSSIFTAGMTLQIVLDADSGKCWIGYNNTFLNSTGGTTGNPSAGTNPTFTISTTSPILLFLEQNTSDLYLNAGQRPFAYTAPSGFKALCTQNLPTPTIGATTATQAGKYFGVTLRTGGAPSGGTYTTTVDMSNGALLWDKPRNQASDHYLVDTNRGLTKFLQTDLTNAESTQASWYTSFGNGTYSTGSTDWGSGVSLVDWIWAAGANTTNTSGSITSTVSANTTSGFSVVTYTGTGTAATIGHGLGVAPSMLIFKSRSNGSENWNVYHKSLGASTNILLNSTIAAFTDAAFLNATAPTSTVLSVGGAGSTGTNQSSGTYVCYAFAEVAGYSKFGSYFGNGSTDGPFVYTGFRPAYVMIKNTVNGSTNWRILDSKRNTYNVIGETLQADTSDAGANFTLLDFLSNGFKLRNTFTDFNLSSSTYIFMAFAEAPTKFSLAR